MKKMIINGIKEYKTVFIVTALIAGLFHILYEIYRFLWAAFDGSFKFTIYYNRYGEAWADAIAFPILLGIAVIGLALYAKEIHKK